MRAYLFLVLSAFAYMLAPSVQADSLNICLVSGSSEDDSDKALGIFKNYLEQNFDVNCILLKAEGWENIPGLEALDSCDVALFYTCRLEIDGDQLEHVKKYCSSGKPLVAVRTASHGFQKWLTFDKEVLGGNYQGHFDEGPTSRTFVMPSGKDHPILDNVETFRSRYSLYKTAPVVKDATVLMMGRTPDSGRGQPLAWVREHNGGRIFYTSLGGVGDFENSAFDRMIANALFWTAKQPAAKKEPMSLSPRIRKDGALRLSMRKRIAVSRKGDEWQEATLALEWPVAETAVIVCDMWDKHWCDFASERVGRMAPVMNDVLKKARAAGIQIIHCPSETLGFYQDTMPRRRMLAVSPSALPTAKKFKAPKLPIDASDGGCPGSQKFYLAWTRQHPAIEIMDTDGISEKGKEIFNYLEQEGIKNIIYMGVHTNMCVLGRSFGIRKMSQWGLNCALVRDLTDALYNPDMPPKVSHDEGTALVIEHIEKYWCPSLLSADLVSGLTMPKN